MDRIPGFRTWTKSLTASCILLAFILLFSSGTAAKDISKMDSTLRAASWMQLQPDRLVNTVPGVSLRKGEAYITVFIEQASTPPPLEDYGAETLLELGSTRLVRMPLASLDAVAALPGVKRMKGDAWVRHALNVSVPANDLGGIRADMVWNEGRWGNLQGQGVIAGMVDTGINLGHNDFLDSSGVSRVVWAKNQETGETCFPRQGGTCSVSDVGDPHGSHVMGVMASNGRGGCNDPNASGLCVGVAPRADIMVVKTPLSGPSATVSKVLEAVQALFTQAILMGKPAVVNLSLGWFVGSHDGQGYYERQFSNVYQLYGGAGYIMVASAGNSALERSHASISVSQSDGAVRRTLSIDCDPYTDAHSEIYGWYDTADGIQVRAFSESEAAPTPEQYWQAFGGSSERNTNYGTVTIAHNITNEDASARGFTITLNEGLTKGRWHVEVRNQGGQTAQAVDLWVSSFFVICTNSVSGYSVPPRFIEDDADPYYTIHPPCTSDDIICVSSYNTKCKGFLDPTSFCKGCSRSFPDSCVPWKEAVGTISHFSSMGPNRVGAQKPAVAAPGQAIIVAGESGQSYFYVAGTSFSAPHVAGVVALMLQANPYLTAAEAEKILIETARPHDGGSPSWRPDWGWGMVDAYAAVARVARDVPTYGPRDLGDGNDFCFIATSAFRDSRSPGMDLMREAGRRILILSVLSLFCLAAMILRKVQVR